MFGLFNKKSTTLDLEVALAEVAQAEQATRSLARKLLKAQEETDRVLKRMASDLQSARNDIANLTRRIDELELVCEGNTELVCDTAEQTKIHQRQVAGLYRTLDRMALELATKGAVSA